MTGKLNPDLMMPAGIQMNFKQGTGTAVSSRSGCKYLIMKFCNFCLWCIFGADVRGI